MLSRRARRTFEDWLRVVNALTLAAHQMSIYELEDDIPRELLRQAYNERVTPSRCVSVMVTPLFFPEGFDDAL